MKRSVDPLKICFETARVMCAKKFVVERYYIFDVIASMGLIFDDGTGPANASRDGLVKLWGGALIICNTITL